MFDPWRRLKSLPWAVLFQVALIATIALAIVDGLLGWGLVQVGDTAQVRSLLASPILGILLSAAAAYGVGALAVYGLERWFPQVILNTASLWALVFCLLVVLFIKLVLPIPSLLLSGLGGVEMAGVVLGVFQQGRRYWRW